MDSAQWTAQAMNVRAWITGQIFIAIFLLRLDLANLILVYKVKLFHNSDFWQIFLTNFKVNVSNREVIISVFATVIGPAKIVTLLSHHHLAHPNPVFKVKVSRRTHLRKLTLRLSDGAREFHLVCLLKQATNVKFRSWALILNSLFALWYNINFENSFLKNVIFTNFREKIWKF